MATLCITEIKDLAFDPHGHSVLAPKMPPIAEQSVAIGGASGQSEAFANSTRYVMLECDTPCCLGWGPNPTALVGFHRMAANEVRFYGVNGGEQLAVIVSP